MTARASVERVVVECPAEQLRVAGAPRVAPHVDRRDRPAARVESEQPVPERGHTDGARLGGRPIRVHPVEARSDRVEQSRRVVLDTAIGRHRG